MLCRSRPGWLVSSSSVIANQLVLCQSDRMLITSYFEPIIVPFRSWDWILLHKPLLTNMSFSNPAVEAFAPIIRIGFVCSNLWLESVNPLLLTNWCSNPRLKILCLYVLLRTGFLFSIHTDISKSVISNQFFTSQPYDWMIPDLCVIANTIIVRFRYVWSCIPNHAFLHNSLSPDISTRGFPIAALLLTQFIVRFWPLWPIPPNSSFLAS